MGELLFPDEAIAILRGAEYAPDAERRYEVMTGSFWWSDELVRETSAVCLRHDNWAFRFLMGYRASLIRGEPDAGPCRLVWEQVAAACPNWPGFRPERNSQTLAPELHRANRRQCVEFLRWQRESQIQQSDA